MNEAEIKAKIEHYVDAHFGGWEAAFAAYAENGEMSIAKVDEFVTDAGVSRWLVSIVRRRIMAAADSNKNGRLSLSELKHAIEGE